ncbi:MAG: hypothetical protein GF331_10165 [Chitinivibrionales bacterium]|nr:hypothetical protein [Chitinivibrionales bacterium]
MMVRPLWSSLSLILALSVAAPAMQVGANTWFHVDWTNDFPFKDLMMSCREWKVMDADNNWDYPHGHLGRESYPLSSISWDENLYPTSIPQNGKKVVTLMAVSIRENVGGYPFGTFTLLFEGTGELLLAWDGGNPRPDTGWGSTWSPGFLAPANVVSVKGTGGTTRHEFTIDSPQDWFDPSIHKSMGILLQIVQSDQADHIRNIRVIMPDRQGGTSYVESYEEQKFNPVFLNDHRIYDVLRFMDWAQTNHSSLSTWAERVEPDDVIQTASKRGMAYEHMIDLCNTIGCDMWANVPHQADDEYVRGMAELIERRLDPDLDVYVEYSNEIWNDGMFEQGPWCQEQGYELSFDTLTIDMGGYTLGMNKWHVADAFKVYRSCEIYTIFEDVFAGEDSRVHNVLSSGGFHFLERPEVNPLGTMPEVAARPLYWSWNISDIDDQLGKLIRERDDYGVAAVAYEGGNHESCAFDDATRYDAYLSAMQYMADKGLSLFNQYVGVSPLWVMQGCFGVKNYAGQPESEAHKFRALLDYQISEGNHDPDAWEPRVATHRETTGDQSGIVTPGRLTRVSISGGSVRLHVARGTRLVTLTDAQGRQSARVAVPRDAGVITVSGLAPGLYLLREHAGGIRSTGAVLLH